MSRFHRRPLFIVAAAVFFAAAAATFVLIDQAAADQPAVQPGLNPNLRLTATPTPTPVPLVRVPLANLTGNRSWNGVPGSYSRLMLPSTAVARPLPLLNSAYSGMYAYTTNPAADTVSVISLATDLVMDTIYLGDGPGGMTFDPVDQTTLYKVDANTSSLSILYVPVDKEEFNWNPVEKLRLPVGKQPFAVAVSPDGLHVYVANMGDGTVTVINKHKSSSIIGYEVAATVHVGLKPRALAVSPDGSQVYVSCYGSSRLAVIDAATNTLARSIAVGQGPIGLAVSKYGLVYVASSGDNKVYEVDPAGGQVLKNFTVGDYPCAVAVIPDHPEAGGPLPLLHPVGIYNDTHVWLYVANGNNDSLSVINTGTGNVTTKNGVLAPFDIVARPGSDLAYVLTMSGNRVYVYNTTTDSLKTTFRTTVDPQQDYTDDDPMGGQHSGAFSYNGHIFMVSYGSGVVYATTQDNYLNHVYGGIMGQKAPQDIIMSPDGKTVYVSCYFDSSVLAIDTATNEVTARIAVDPNPREMAISKDGTRLYVACPHDFNNQGGGSVVKIDTTTGQVLNHFKLPSSIFGPPMPRRVALSDYDDILFILCTDNLYGEVYAIDTNMGTATLMYDTYDQPWDMTMLHSGRFLYVIDYQPKQYNASLFELDTATYLDYETVLDPGPNGYSVQGYTIKSTPDSSYLYILYGFDVYLVDTTSSEVSAKYEVNANGWQGGLEDLAFTPDAKYAYFTGVYTMSGDFTEHGLVVVVDTASGACVGTIPVGAVSTIGQDYLAPHIAIGHVPPPPATPTPAPAVPLTPVYSRVGVQDLFPGLAAGPGQGPALAVNRTIIAPLPVSNEGGATPTPAPATPTPDVGPAMQQVTPAPGASVTSQPTSGLPTATATPGPAGATTSKPAPGFELITASAGLVTALWLATHTRKGR